MSWPRWPVCALLPLLGLGLLLSWAGFSGLTGLLWSARSLRGPAQVVPAVQWGALGLEAPPPLPSEPASPEEDRAIKRGIYGGRGDKAHLGGFTDFDQEGFSNNTFNFMLGPLGVKSVVDVGCGRGFSTNRFRELGARVLCVEGSRDAIERSVLPRRLVLQHDFSRGPWWPSRTFDAAWAVEFLEHVGRQFLPNYLPVFRRAALVFVTCSPWGTRSLRLSDYSSHVRRRMAPRRGTPGVVVAVEVQLTSPPEGLICTGWRPMASSSPTH